MGQPANPATGAAHRRRSSTRQGSTRNERNIVLGLTAVSALGGALSGVEPAGWLPIDIFWGAATAALVTYAAARARRWTLIVLAGVAAVTATGWWLLAGAGALIGASVAALTRRRSRPLGALIGALAVQALLRMDLGPTGVSAVVTAVAVGPVLVSAWRWSRSRIRRQVGIVVAVLGGLAVLATVGLAVAAVLAQQQVRDGADAVRDGLDAVRDNDPERAVVLLSQASDDLDDAHRAASTWGLPARLVPLLGHQARVIDTVTGEGAALAGTAATAAIAADTEEIRFEDGVIDLELVARFEEPLDQAADALAQASERMAEARSPWLIGPLATGAADFADEVDGALPDAELAREGVRLAPGLFGGEGERRYLVLFTTPAEARGLGGFVGNYAELTAMDGDVELTRSGRASADLRPRGEDEDYVLDGPADYLARWGRYRPGRFVQDTTYSPDFPSVAQVWEQIYPQAPGGSAIDGVILVDPYGLAALMEFTGPIDVPGWPVPLTADNAADILLRQQYLAYTDEKEQRIEFLDDATRLTFEELTEGDVPGPRRVADVLGPMVDQGRLAVYGVDPDEQALFERVGVDNTFPQVDGDFLAVALQNSGNSKIDTFLDRSVAYDVAVDPASGATTAEVTIEMRNSAPASGLPDYVIGVNNDSSDAENGTNLGLLTVYTSAEVVDARLDGEPAAISVAEELGYNAYSFFVQVPPGGAQTAVLRLNGQLPRTGEYALTWAPQPLVRNDDLRIEVTPAEGARVCDPGDFEQRDGGLVAGDDAGVDRTYRALFCD